MSKNINKYFEQLNSEQIEAVEKLSGPLLVLAGAGTGKTRVLTTRLSHILFTKQAVPSQIFAVTFTNKAAQEMKSRVQELLDFDISAISIGTFHSISAQILRKEIHHLGISNNFIIYD